MQTPAIHNGDSAVERPDAEVKSSDIEKETNASIEASEAQDSTNHDSELYQAIDSYDWDNDSVYQRALEHMSKTSNVDGNELQIRAKCFYWERKFKTKVDESNYRSWKSAQDQNPNESVGSLATDLSQAAINDDKSSATTSRTSSMLASITAESSGADETPYPIDFNAVADMITSGRGHLLPGNRQIPETVLADMVTPPTKELRKKPWEKEGAELPIGGMFGDRRDIFIKQE